MLVERKDVLNEDGSLGYCESIFDSSNILKVTYFPKQNRLYIAFNRGHTYSYENITPEIYEEFEKAESQGKYFLSKIKNRQEFPYRKEFSLFPSEIEQSRKIIQEVKNNKEDE
jgi:hypothetical protein